MKIIRWIKVIYPYLFCLLLLCVPFDKYIRAVPNILLIVLICLFPFIIKKRDFKKLYSTLGLLFALFFSYLILNTLVFNGWVENGNIIKKIGLSVGLVILYLPIKNLTPLKRGIISSALVAILFSVFKIIVLIIQSGSFKFSNGMNPIETLPMDRLYIGLLCMTSILISLNNIVKQKKAWLNLANIILTSAFIFLIVSRISIITLIGLVVLYFIFSTIKTRTLLLCGAGILLFLTIAVSLNKNIQKRFLLTTSNPNRSFKERLFLMEPRTKIWDCAYEIAKDRSSFFTGLGFESTIQHLVDCYKWNINIKERQKWYVYKRYNTHNQFIDFYLSTGILSFILFCSFMGAIYYYNRRSFFTIGLLFVFILFCSIEAIFHRQIGAYYFGFFLIFVLLKSQKLNSSKKPLL